MTTEIEAAAKALPSEWRLVSELPSYALNCWVLAANYGDEASKVVRFTRWENGSLWWCNLDGYVSSYPLDVWHPLPVPPKKPTT